MHLSLTVMKCRGKPAARQSLCVRRESALIGRAHDNDLVLADPENYISRYHALIHHEGRDFFLTDTSLIGTQVNGKTLNKNDTAVLRDGTKIKIGDYELAVAIVVSDNDETLSGDSSATDDILTEIVSPRNYSFYDSGQPYPDNLQETELGVRAKQQCSAGQINPESQDVPASRAKARERDPKSSRRDPDLPEKQFDPDAATLIFRSTSFDVDDASELPDDSVSDSSGADSNGSDENVRTEDSNESSQADERLTDEKAQAGRIPYTGSLIQVLLDAIGIEDVTALEGRNEEEIVRLIGKMFAQLVEGLMQLLRTRAELKNQFRLSVTTIRPAENNPLKFSVSAAEAMQILLKPTHKGYMKPLDAVRNGLDDLSVHDRAMIAGVRSALIELLADFEPAQFEKRVPGGIFKKKDVKSWENYCNRYNSLVNQSIDGFFGEVFIKAYEKHLREAQIQPDDPFRTSI